MVQCPRLLCCDWVYKPEREAMGRGRAQARRNQKVQIQQKMGWCSSSSRGEEGKTQIRWVQYGGSEHDPTLRCIMQQRGQNQSKGEIRVQIEAGDGDRGREKKESDTVILCWNQLAGFVEEKSSSTLDGAANRATTTSGVTTAAAAAVSHQQPQHSATSYSPSQQFSVVHFQTR